MTAAGMAFFVSENGVWLTDHVPPQFLLPIEQGIEA
jgi:RNA:NAD 2'-phosphotransferase (TPT1/KptA family)